jgi:hypothetical protein
MQNRLAIVLFLVTAGYLLCVLLTFVVIGEVELLFSLLATPIVSFVYLVIGLIISGKNLPWKQGFLIASGLLILLGLTICGGIAAYGNSF